LFIVISKKLSQTRISLLIELLKSFTEKELTVFSEFIESTYFNKDQKLIDLLKKIKRYALSAEKFTPDLQLKVYEEVYYDKPLNQKELTKKQYMVLNNKQSKLLRLAEQFLVIENLKANQNTKAEFLYRTLTDRNQVNLYGIDYYAHQYKIQEARLHFLISNGMIRKEDNYDQLHYYLDTNYILEKLKYHLAQLTIKNSYQNKNYENFSLYSIKELLNEPQYAENPLIQIYLSNINLIEAQSDASYQELVKSLVENRSKLPALFQRVFHTNLNNYCTAQIKKGNTSYYNNLFKNYRAMHENDLLISDNFIDVILIKNIITVSCFVKKFDWAYKILEAYKKFILPNIKDSVYFYNKGVIAYNKKDFHLAQNWFLKVGKINDTFEIDLRIFLLQCIFEIEQDYNEATRQSFESAKQFFIRNKYLSAVNKKSYLNFMSIFMYLYQFKHQAIKMTLNKILNKLKQMEVIYKKQWLLDKIVEIEK